jgi:poly(ADP-ribose)glycohydrolase PARG
MDCTLRRTYDTAALMRDHPPRLRHPHKQLVFELACPPGAHHAGAIAVTRWRADELPGLCELAATEITCERGHYRYDGQPGVWHVNFADPQLFYAYGGALLAQDELQALEHPALGSIREALLAEGDAATTVADVPTPVLVAGVERRCALDTSRGLYGNAFARASEAEVRAALTVLDPPPRSNLIAMAAPGYGRGRYTMEQLATVLVTAYTGFAAARDETAGAPVEIRTGFWGCGAFGGNRRAMTLLQLLAARLAGVDRVRFYAFDERGAADFAAGAAELEGVLGPEHTMEVLARVAELGYVWGASDGN